jgi:hypothetical protein
MIRLTNITLAIWVFKKAMREDKTLITHFLFKIVLVSDKTGMNSDSLTTLVKSSKGIKAFPYTKVNIFQGIKFCIFITHS